MEAIDGIASSPRTSSPLYYPPQSHPRYIGSSPALSNASSDGASSYTLSSRTYSHTSSTSSPASISTRSTSTRSSVSTLASKSVTFAVDIKTPALKALQPPFTVSLPEKLNVQTLQRFSSDFGQWITKARSSDDKDIVNFVRRLEDLASKYEQAVTGTKAIARRGSDLAKDVIQLLSEALDLNGNPVHPKRLQLLRDRCEESSGQAAVCAVEFRKLQDELKALQNDVCKKLEAVKRCDLRKQNMASVVRKVTIVLSAVTVISATTAAILAAPFLGAAVAAGAAIFAGHMTFVANAACAASGGVQVVDRMIDIYARRSGHEASEKQKMLKELSSVLEIALGQTAYFGQWWDQHTLMFECLLAGGGLRIRKIETTRREVQSLQRLWRQVQGDMDAYIAMIDEASSGGSGSTCRLLKL